MKFFPLPFDLKKIVSLYVLLLIFTLFAYLIISSDLNLFLKILIKISMILCFVLIGFWKKILTFDHLIFLKGKNVFFDKLIFKIQSTK
jgi:hypothetical protein